MASIPDCFKCHFEIRQETGLDISSSFPSLAISRMNHMGQVSGSGAGHQDATPSDVSTPSIQSRLLASSTPSLSAGKQDTEVFPMWSMVKNILNEHDHSKAPCDSADVNPVSEVNPCSEIYDRLSTYFSLVPPNEKLKFSLKM